jgi:hypothetical protein
MCVKNKMLYQSELHGINVLAASIYCLLYYEQKVSCLEVLVTRGSKVNFNTSQVKFSSSFDASYKFIFFAFDREMGPYLKLK